VKNSNAPFAGLRRKSSWNSKQGWTFNAIAHPEKRCVGEFSLPKHLDWIAGDRCGQPLTYDLTIGMKKDIPTPSDWAFLRKQSKSEKALPVGSRYPQVSQTTGSPIHTARLRVRSCRGSRICQREPCQLTRCISMPQCVWQIGHQ
jgi:hypothetical protein